LGIRVIDVPPAHAVICEVMSPKMGVVATTVGAAAGAELHDVRRAPAAIAAAINRVRTTHARYG